VTDGLLVKRQATLGVGELLPSSSSLAGHGCFRGDFVVAEGPDKGKESPHIDLNGLPARYISTGQNTRHKSDDIPLIGVAVVASEPMKAISLILRGRCLTPDLLGAASE
jgi:hypothetical protein